jgi:hypothetical protein
MKIHSKITDKITNTKAILSASLSSTMFMAMDTYILCGRIIEIYGSYGKLCAKRDSILIKNAQKGHKNGSCLPISHQN